MRKILTQRLTRTFEVVVAAFLLLGLMGGAGAAPYPGTAVGTPSYTAASTPFGQKIVLNGSSQYATLPSPGPWDALSSSGFTITARITTTVTTGGPYVVIGQSNGSAYSFLGVYNSHVSCNLNGFSGVGSVTGTINVADGAEHNIAVVYNGSTFTLYVDGTADVTSAAGTYVPAGGPSYLGGWSSTGNYFNGGIAECAVFTSASSAAAVINPSAAYLNSTANLAALYHFDGTLTDSTTTPAVTVLPTDANWYASPYTWANGFTNCTGAYRQLNFTTTAAGNVLLNLDTTSIGSTRPYLSWSTDGGPLTTLQLTNANLIGTSPAQAVAISTGLASGSHSLYLVVRSQQSTDSTIWANGTIVISSTAGLSLPVTATTSAWSPKSINILAFGDSITEGEGTEGQASANYPANSDATHAWGYYVASALGAEYGNVGSGGQSFAGTGANGYPAFNTSWSSINAAVSRLSGGKFAPAPDYVIVNQGTNASPSAANIATMMTNLRGAGGATTKNIFLIPFGQYGKSNILAGLTAYGGSYSTVTIPNGTVVYTAASDSNTWVIDLGTVASTGLTLYSSQAATRQAAEGVHPYATVQSQEAAFIVRAIQAKSLLLFVKRKLQ